MANGSGHVSVAGEAWLARFHAEPLTVDPSKDSCWFRGQHADTGGVLLRRIEGISFSDAIRDLTELLETLDQTQPGIMRCLAIVVSADGKIVAGSAAASSNFTVAADPAAAAALVGDSFVDVWAIYPDTGDEALVECRTDPLAACERLASLAEVLDRLPNGHGAIDSTSLRTGPSGPILLGTRLAPLEASRRGRLDATGPWLTVAPERCLPPGRGTPAGDQYALAVLWTVARGGSPPHEAATAEALVRSKLSEPPSLVGLEEAERSVVARALSSAAEDRFESSVAFVAALRAAIQPNVPAAAAGTLPVRESETAVGLEPATTPEPVPEPPASPAADTRPGSLDATQPLQDEANAVPHEQIVIPREPVHEPAAPVAMTGQAVLLSTPPYKAGDMILPGYRLERPLGKGGFGEVWRAAAPGGMSVAIKVISRLGRREGSREFRALRTVKDVHHAHIVPIFGVWLKTSDGRLLDEIEAEQAGERILQGQDRGIRGTVAAGSGAGLDSLELVVAMGLGDRSLSDELQARAAAGGQGVEAGQLLGWMRQAALAIDHFNRGSARDGVTAAAVQHCDIKPQNMLLVGNVVQVCDFGLARVQGQVRATANNLLSIAYAAPEMMVKPYDPSPHTDQYSLAVTYYELRTGRLPYGEQPESSADDISAPELMLAKTKGEVRLTRVPPTEQRVLERALALEPAGRFGSCTEFVDMLEAAVDTDLAEVGPARAGRIPWLPIVGLSVGGLASAALLAWVLLGPAEGGPGGTGPSKTTVKDPAAIAKQRQKSDAADLVGQIEQEIAGVVGEDGGIDRRRLATARSLGERLMTLDGRRGSEQSQAVAAIEEIAEVLADPGPEPRGLDAAVSEFDRANAVLPKAVANRLGAALAAKLVDRADRRLRDHDLQSDGVPVQGKKRAIEDSLWDLEKAIRLDSRSWLAWNRLGFCESLRGGYDTAIDHYTKALELGPSTASERQDVLRHRAFACVEAGRLSDAADDYLASYDRHVIRKLWALYDEKAWPSGNYAAAAHILELLRNTLDESPDDFQAGATPGPDDVIGDLAWLLACGFGDDPPNRAVPMSKRYLERVLEGDPDPDKESNARGTLACSYARAGRFADAIEELKAARAAGLEPDAFEKRLEAFEAGKPWDLPLE